MSTTEKITNWLFQTEALRVCAPDQPFWYTSGTIGPYYINTHFLFGSEATADKLLFLIESSARQPEAGMKQLADEIERQYDENSIYHELCDMIAEEMNQHVFDFVSGGERRDFFFSIQAAKLLGKPHMSILKNGSCYISDRDFSRTIPVKHGERSGQIAYHVADLVTQASSYDRAWIPAVKACGAAMPRTLAVVDRDQGGRELLEKAGTDLVSLTKIDQSLFDHAKDNGLISSEQYDMIMQFTVDPIAFMREFFVQHPTFIDQQIALGGKNRDRALLCQEKGYAGPF